jgi:hypothetical protein
MTEERFEELTHLYFDEEITPQQLGELKAELKEDPDRKAAFLERMRFEKASRKALYSRTRTQLEHTLRTSSPSQASTNRSPFGLFRWAVLATCLCIVAFQWLRLNPPPDLLAGFDELPEGTHAAVDALPPLSVAEIVEIRGLIIQFTSIEMEDINGPITAVVANRQDKPTIGTLSSEDQLSPQIDDIVSVAEQQPRRINRPLEVYPFHGNIREDFPQPTSSNSPSPSSMRFLPASFSGQ